MLVKNIHKKIQETLEARRRALSRKEIKFGEEKVPIDTPSFSDLASRSTFVRMVSNKDDVTNTRVIQGGTLDQPNEDGALSTNFGFDGFLGPYKEIRAGKNSIRQSEGIRTISGIKDISVEYAGNYKATRKATINWVVNSMEDLIDLNGHFLTVGKTVLLDWGWVYKRKELNNFTTFFTPDENDLRVINQDAFDNPMPIIYQSGGNYDAIGGVISNFEYKLREDGGFDCVTYLTSIGISLFDSYSIDKGSTEFQLTTDSSGNVSQIHNDNIVNAVLNLDYILDDYIGSPTKIDPVVTDSLGNTQSTDEQRTAEMMTGAKANATLGRTNPFGPE